MDESLRSAQRLTTPVDSAPSSAQPYLKIRPGKGWSPLNLREIWSFRDLLQILAIRDVKLRYRQTALGALWVILQPIVAAGIFSLVFGIVANLPSEGVPYFIFAYAGLLGWNAFNSTLTKASSSLVSQGGLISKVFFPRLILPLATVASTIIDFLVALAVMACLLVIYQISPGWELLLLPFWLFLVLLLAMGIGLFSSALMVTYRDVQHVLPVVTNILFLASPIAYSLDTAIERIGNINPLLNIFFQINPLVGLLEAFRWTLLGTAPPHWGYLAYSGFVAAGLFVVGAFTFTRMARRFADVI